MSSGVAQSGGGEDPTGEPTRKSLRERWSQIVGKLKRRPTTPPESNLQPPPPPNRVVRMLTGGSLLGLLILCVVSWSLAWLTFFALGLIFNSTLYSDIRSFKSFSPADKLECYARAIGYPPSDLKSFAEPASATVLSRSVLSPTLTKEGREELQKLAVMQPYRVVGHTQLTSAREGKEQWHKVGSEVGLPQPDGPSFAVVWRSGDGPPAGAADGDKPKPNAKVEMPLVYVLEIKAVEVGLQFKIVARYFPVIDGKEQPSAVKEAFVVLDRPTYWFAALQPCAVNHSAGELASRFVDQMKADVRGRPNLVNIVLKDRAKVQEVETFIQQVILRKLGKELPSGGSEQGLRTDREYETLEQRTAWPRRLQGSDVLGVIQFLTVVAFWAAVVIYFAQWRVVENQRDYLESGELFPTDDTTVDHDHVEARVRSLEALRQKYREGQGRDSVIACIPLEIAYSGYCGLIAANMRAEGVPAFVQTRVSLFLERAGSRQWLFRFLVWLIPSIGFVGTVIGIGDALLGTGDVLSTNPLQQQSAIQAIAGKLGTAFDATFVALILSIVTMFMIGSIQKSEEELIQRAAERTLNSLIDPNQVSAPPHASLQPLHLQPATAVTAAPNPSAPRRPQQPVVLRLREIRPLRRRYSADAIAIVVGITITLGSLTIYFGKDSAAALAVESQIKAQWANLSKYAKQRE